VRRPVDDLLALLREPWLAEPHSSPNVADPAGVWRLAVEARLGPRVAPRLKRLAPQLELGEVRLRALCATERARRELGETLAALSHAGAPCLVLKGLALAARSAPALSARGFTDDLDLLLLDLNRFDAAREALAALGLHGRAGLPGPIDSDWTFSGSGRLPVDLHLRLGGRLLSGSLALSAGDPDTVDLGDGVRVPTLDLASTLGFAAMQLHKDLPSLRRLVDLAGLLGRFANDEAALSQAEELVRGVGLSGFLGWAARRAHEWLGAPPPRAWDGLKRGAPRRLLEPLERPEAWVGAPRPGPAAAGCRRLWRVALLDRPGREVPRFLWGELAGAPALARRGEGLLGPAARWWSARAPRVGVVASGGRS
jgi:hypothetical protein